MTVKSPPQQSQATPADLARTPGKAELIGGKIVRLMPTGLRPNLVAGRIYRSLADFVDVFGRGVVVTDNAGFVVPRLPSGRESFSPDAAWFDGPYSTADMGFLQGPPTFAVEVRSEGDYGPAAERSMAAKRTDYFAAGTAIVWDVDPVALCVRSHTADAPPRLFDATAVADAEPVLSGWCLPVSRLAP